MRRQRGIGSGGTHRDFDGPELTTQLTVELHGHLGSHTHQVLLLAQGSLEDTLGGDGLLHAAQLLDGVVAVLTVTGQHHYHLPQRERVG